MEGSRFNWIPYEGVKNVWRTEIGSFTFQARRHGAGRLKMFLYRGDALIDMKVISETMLDIEMDIWMSFMFAVFVAFTEVHMEGQ